MGLPAVLLLVLTTCLSLILETTVHTHQEAPDSKGFWLGSRGEKGSVRFKTIHPKRQFLSIQSEHLNASDRQVTPNIA